VLDVDAPMRQVLVKDPTEAAIAVQAREAGMLGLRAAAVLKARHGLTTFEEAVRVTAADSAGGTACPSCRRAVQSGMLACPWCAVRLDCGRCGGCAKPVEPEWVLCPWCLTASGTTPGR
jgi:type IV pilus assembly protein PilB